MIKADVLITNKDWKKYIREPSVYINSKLKRINKKTNLFKINKFNFSLLLAGNTAVKKLNIKFRKKNKTTDILSFPFHEMEVKCWYRYLHFWRNGTFPLWNGTVVWNGKSKGRSDLEVSHSSEDVIHS